VVINTPHGSEYLQAEELMKWISDKPFTKQLGILLEAWVGSRQSFGNQQMGREGMGEPQRRTLSHAITNQDNENDDETHLSVYLTRRPPRVAITNLSMIRTKFEQMMKFPFWETFS
jgi:hypothetical protein